MSNYKWIITGGGASGLILCNELINSKLEGNVLLIEQSVKKKNDKTWCFWSEDELGEIINSNFFWKKCEINSFSETKDFAMFPFAYRLIHAGEFYERMYDHLSKNDRVTIVNEAVTSVRTQGQHVEVRTSQNEYVGSWVFNSLLSFAPIPSEARTGLKQHFLGNWIETDRDVFDPEKLSLMDFRVEQEGCVQFMYVLPVSPRRALVEYTVFSKDVWAKSRYQQKITTYLEEKYGLHTFTLIEEESGVIPMCPKVFPRMIDGRIVHIGSAGGLTKASTGYTFHRIVEDSKALVTSMERFARPIPKLYATGRFGFYDRLLIWIIKHKPEKIPGIMLRLFGSKPRSVFRFLAEKSTLFEEINLFLRLPWSPFLTALWHEYIAITPKKSLGSTPQSHNFDLPLGKLANGNQQLL